MDSLRYSDVVYVSIDRLGWLTMMTGNGFAMVGLSALVVGFMHWCLV